MRIFKFVSVRTFATILLSLFLLYTCYNSFSYLLEEGDIVELAEEEESGEETEEGYELQFEGEEYWNHSITVPSISRQFVDFYNETYEDVVISGAPQPPELMS